MYEQSRLPGALAALNDVKGRYVEVVNPLLSRRMIGALHELPDELRAYGRVYNQVVDGESRPIPYSRFNSTLAVDECLDDPALVEVIVRELSSARVERVLDREEAVLHILAAMASPQWRRPTLRGETTAVLKLARAALPAGVARRLTPREGFALPVSEDGLGKSNLVVSAPSLKLAPRLAPKRNLPLLASFPAQSHDPVLEVGGGYLESFGDPGSGVIEESKEQMVTPSRPGRQVCGGEDGLNLRTAEKAEQGFVGALTGNGEDPLSLIDEVGCNLGEEKTHECANGGQSCVARTGSIVALLLQMFQECKDRFRAKDLEGDPIDRYAPLLCDEVQE